MKKNILVPVDFSGDSINALEHAIFIANKLNASIKIMHVKAEKNFDVPFYFSKEFDKHHGKTPEDFCKLIIEKYKDKVNNAFDYVVREGKIYAEVTNQAKYSDAHMIIMGTHGASGFDEFFTGSNSFRVVAQSPCPVLTIRHGFMRRELKNIVMLLDHSPGTREKIPFVTEFAKVFDSTLHILGVCDNGKDKERVTHVEANMAKAIKYAEKKEVKYKKDFKSSGNNTEATIDYASQVASELIAIMIEQPANALNFLLGSYAQQMVNHSPIPVLSLHTQKNV